MKVGDLVKVRASVNTETVGIIVSFKSIHYGGKKYCHVLVDGEISPIHRKNLEVLNESR